MLPQGYLTRKKKYFGERGRLQRSVLRASRDTLYAQELFGGAPALPRLD